MSIAITRPGTGTHRADDVIAERDQKIQQLAADNQALIADSENNARDIHTALIRGCQDAIALAAALDENKQLKARVKQLGDKVIRDAADKERLRQAVKDARPRITQVDTQLVRPYAPVVAMPYVSPVPHRDTSNETTQEMAIVDQPEPWPVYTARNTGSA